MYKKVQLEYDPKDLTIFSEASFYEHYDILYGNYMISLNNIFKENNIPFMPIEDVFKYIDTLPCDLQEDILFYAGGYYNHSLFFQNLIPKDYMMTLDYTELDQLIDEQFGNKKNLKKKIVDNMLKSRGSMYTHLVSDDNKKLSIINTSNQDNPLSDNLYPLITIDLWEHTYYIDYLSDKRKYYNEIVDYINFKVGNYRLGQII